MWLWRYGGTKNVGQKKIRVNFEVGVGRFAIKCDPEHLWRSEYCHSAWKCMRYNLATFQAHTALMHFRKKIYVAEKKNPPPRASNFWGVVGVYGKL